MKKKKLWLIAAVILFFVFTFCLYGPLGLYLQNAAELFFSLKDVLMIVICVSVCAAAVLAVLLYALPEKAGMFLLKLLFGISLGMYVQGTLINISYGVLDGNTIPWQHYTK